MSKDKQQDHRVLPDGLTTAEAVEARTRFGKNIPGVRRGGYVLRLVRDILVEPMFLLLLFAGVLYFLLHKPGEGALMLLALGFVGAISFYQEMKRHRALSALKSFTEPRVRTVRDGRLQVLQGWELVPRDIILLEEGEKVPADAEVLDAHDLTVNESVITGESIPVEKVASDTILLGSMLNTGACYGRVVETGPRTFLGRMGKKIAEMPEERTALQRQINGFVRMMAIFGATAFLLVWGINFWHSGDLAQSFLLGLTLAMTAIPEEIPIAFSSFLALGGWRMAKLGIIISKPTIMDYLGTVTTLCLDKTGTLTENKMQVSWLYDHTSGMAGSPPPPGLLESRVLSYGRLASEAEPFDAMEQAIVARWMERQDTADHDGLVMIHEYPLAGHPPMMTHVYRRHNGELVVAAKGAPERILMVCKLSPALREEAMARVGTMAAKGYRVLGVASAKWEDAIFPADQADGTVSADQDHAVFPADQDGFDWKFEGFIGLFDPPKPGLREVFADWKRAGIQTKILSGDHPGTISTIALSAGMPEGEILTGADILDLSDEELRKRVKEVDSYARMFPDAKFKVIRALKDNEEIVAMTGDGVNDAPALKAAHIGIAMGKKGTELARQAADLVISDDQLDRITEAIRHGRMVHDNLKKAIRYLIGIHIPIILTVLLPLVLGWKYAAVFTPIHIVFLELIMGPTCSVFYEREPAEADSMAKAPSMAGQGFFDKREGTQTIVQGLLASAGMLAVYFYFMQGGATLAYVRSVVFVAILLTNLLLTFISRSFTEPVWRSFRYRNRLTGVVVVLSAGFLALVMGVPFVRDLFGMVPVKAVDLGLVAGTVTAGAALMEIMKRFGRKPRGR